MNEAAAAPRASKAVIAWAFYDWVNSAFATTVITTFFPLLLKRYWGEGVEAVLVPVTLDCESAECSTVGVSLGGFAPEPLFAS